MRRYDVVEYLERAAQDAPSKTAVIDAFGSCTYAELRELSLRAASRLTEHGLAAGRGVVIIAEKSIEMLAAMLGTVYAGGFYAPVDPASSVERVRAICAALGDSLVVACDSASATLEGTSPDIDALPLSKLLLEPPTEGAVLASDGPIDADTAYVMFTSGSTGMPKGVVVSHRAAMGFIDSFIETFGICESDVIANQAPFDFDVSVKDIYGAIAAKATLVIVPRSMFTRPAELVDYLIEGRITIMTWAVAALCMVTQLHGLDGKSLPSVRMVLFSGEVMPMGHLREWMNRLPEALFVNLYGPTEATCNCLYHIVDRKRSYRNGIPLGFALPNRRVMLLDANGFPVEEIGQVGELVVSDSLIASGYVGTENEERRAFYVDPHALCEQPAYRTGDLARINEMGELVYCGRKDNQIKHMGHRIELEGIEATVESWPDIRLCRCVYNTDKKKIVAFFEGGATAKEAHRLSNERLPVPMRPARFVPMSSIPTTKNGKIDRSALLREEASYYG